MHTIIPVSNKLRLAFVLRCKCTLYTGLNGSNETIVLFSAPLIRFTESDYKSSEDSH